MMIQTFRAKTLAEAERAARSALGPELEVVTTRRVPRPGLWGALGAVDVEIAVTQSAPPPTSPRATPFSSAAYASDAAPPAPDVSVLRAELRQELRSIQGMVARTSSAAPSLEGEIAALRDAIERLGEPELPRAGALARVLRTTGLEGKAAVAIVKALRGRGAPSPDAVRDALADLIRVGASPLGHGGPLVVGLVGPAGVGKTTTAAKLAARALYEHQKSVTLVSCDMVRVGALAQIERFAQILGVQLVTARTAAELSRAVAAAETDLVIVDTSGSTPRTADSPERVLGAASFAMKGKIARERSVLLCLPAAVRADDAGTAAKAFAATHPTALAITKLDETRTPAGLVHAAVAADLPVGVLCFGPRVPEDVAPATNSAILDYLVPKGRRR